MESRKRATHVHPGDRVFVNGHMQVVAAVEPIPNRSAERLLLFTDGSSGRFYHVQSPDPDRGVYKSPESDPFGDGYAFEARVAARIAQDYQIIRAGGGPGDGGIDIIAMANDDGHRLAVQCKNWPRSPVGEPIIRDFIRVSQGYEELVIVTTGEFSRPAATLAANSDITMIDHLRLSAWLSRQELILLSEHRMV